MNDHSDKYEPIACATYDAYEIAIMHRQPLRLAWQDVRGTTHLETVMPLDLFTRSGEEFLVCRTARGAVLRLRLDRIQGSAALC